MKKLSALLIIFGLTFLIIGLVIFWLIFYPEITNEIGYRLKPPNSQVSVLLSSEKPAAGANIIHPVDENFGIVIPKIGANGRVIADVDPYNAYEYQLALTKGVAQAKGSAFPGKIGNVFIFSHSSTDLFQATRYNSIFYLLDKLNKGDDIYLFYHREKFKYQVTDKKIVEASEIEYLSGKSPNSTLTLMTCWPPGTSWKRLVILGEFTAL